MLAKTEGFTEAQVQLAALAKALAHPARIALLEELARRDTCLCGELVDALPLAQATVSRHLKVLKDAGLIRGEVDGPRSCYCLSPEGITVLRSAMSDLLATLSSATPPATCC